MRNMKRRTKSKPATEQRTSFQLSSPAKTGDPGVWIPAYAGMTNKCMPAIQQLQKKHSQFPILDFDLLLAHALHQPREFLYTYPNHRLSLRTYSLLLYYVWQYKRGFSVAAITHHKEFYGLDFYVNKHVLIPRPETELMVEEAVKEIKKTIRQPADQKIILIDVGTGSGCIPIAIATGIRKSGPALPAGRLSGYLDQIIATDISRSALRVARKNARTQNVSIKFLHGNLLEPFIKQFNNLTIEQSSNRAIIITANLPYLTEEQFETEPSIQKEPRSALVAKKQGLALYELLLHQIQSLLQATSYQLQAFLEIDPSQSPAITKLINQILPQASVEIKTDLAGRDRLVKIAMIN